MNSRRDGIWTEVLYGCYLTGQGLVQDVEEAYKWKFVGAALGSECCQNQILEGRKQCRNNLHFSQKLAEGNRRAKDWQHEHSELFVSSGYLFHRSSTL